MGLSVNLKSALRLSSMCFIVNSDLNCHLLLNSLACPHSLIASELVRTSANGPNITADGKGAIYGVARQSGLCSICEGVSPAAAYFWRHEIHCINGVSIILLVLYSAGLQWRHCERALRRLQWCSVVLGRH
jgi:hypothetical protein